MGYQLTTAVCTANLQHLHDIRHWTAVGWCIWFCCYTLLIVCIGWVGEWWKVVVIIIISASDSASGGCQWQQTDVQSASVPRHSLASSSHCAIRITHCTHAWLHHHCHRSRPGLTASFLLHILHTTFTQFFKILFAGYFYIFCSFRLYVVGSFS